MAKRVGRPKLNWAKQTYQEAWKTSKEENPATRGVEFTASNEQYEQLIQFAELRRAPFDTKRKKLPSRRDDMDSHILNHFRVNPPQGGSPTAQQGVPPTGGSPTTQIQEGPPMGGPSHQGGLPTRGPPHQSHSTRSLQNFTAGAPLQVRW